MTEETKDISTSQSVSTESIELTTISEVNNEMDALKLSSGAKSNQTVSTSETRVSHNRTLSTGLQTARSEYFGEEEIYEFKTECYRWVTLIMFCGLIFNITFISVGYSSYLVELGRVFYIGKWTFVLFMVIPNLLYLPTNYIAVMWLSNFRINRVLTLSAIT